MIAESLIVRAVDIASVSRRKLKVDDGSLVHSLRDVFLSGKGRVEC